MPSNAGDVRCLRTRTSTPLFACVLPTPPISDVKTIGYALDTLVKDRNRASYNTRTTRVLIDQQLAQIQLQLATAALALLDQIDADLTRRAAAIASLPPP